jgi:hypothetical protein
VNDTEQGTLPWSLSEVRSAALPIALGIVLLGWSWFQASGTAKMSTQVGWLALAVLATVVAATGASNWVWAGRRAVRARRIALVEALSTEILGPEPELTADGDPTSVPVMVAGTSRYHREDCLLVKGKPVQRLSSTNGQRPCEMCQP